MDVTWFDTLSTRLATALLEALHRYTMSYRWKYATVGKALRRRFRNESHVFTVCVVYAVQLDLVTKRNTRPVALRARAPPRSVRALAADDQIISKP